jgi:flagellar basal-body rod protein FlgG
MITALFTAASGMSAQQLNVDTIANNLANANTTGYKARRTQFQDLIYQNLVQPGTAASQQTNVPAGLQVGLGTRPAGNEIIFAQGSPAATGNPLDVTIQGRGFFQVHQPSGEIAYTRDGTFQLDKNGNIVTASGDPIEPQITLPAQAQAVTIANDGTVSYTLPGQTATQVAASGQPTVAAPGGTEGLGKLMQGYQEQSNVSVVNEFINLIAAQRGYEANSKVVKAADEMYQQVNNIAQ